jgi:hypothetical protein
MTEKIKIPFLSPFSKGGIRGIENIGSYRGIRINRGHRRDSRYLVKLK